MRVLIADDHPLFLLGLRHGLEASGVDVVAAVADGEAAVSTCCRMRPDAAVLDVRMPRMDGLTACQAIVSNECCGLVIFLSTWTDAHVVHAARAAGARGLLSKEHDARSIAAELHQLLRCGERTCFPELQTPNLSTREFQVLDGLARGLTRKRIAVELGISPETVKDHVATLFAKLDAHDRVSVVTQAVGLGIVPLPPVGGGELRDTDLL